MTFTNKVALVTGAAVGIGRAVAHRMAAQGASLILVDRDSEKLTAVKKELAACGVQVLTYACDVTDEEAVRALVAQATAELGAVDILVNNAGIWRSMKPFCEVSSAEWRQYLDVNVMGVVHFTQAVLPTMLEKGYGRIINVASVAGVYGNAGMVHYSATKGALITMTRALAKEVSGQGVTVNSVSPGSVSDSSCPDLDYTQPSTLSFTGRTGSQGENADLICFLASDAASYISGQNIQIDGCRKKM